MKNWIRRLRANLIYLRRPLRSFLPLLLVLVALLIIGGFAFQNLYEVEKGEEPLTYLRALYITYCLIFMEHLIEFPKHPLLQAFYFVLPVLGLVVILDGFVRFGYHLLRRDDTGVEWVRAMAKTFSGHVVLCGLGRVGRRTLEQLVALGENVVVLEKNTDNFNIAYARKHDVPVVIGSGREEGILNDLNVMNAKSIICATDDDLVNLEIALDARKIKPSIRVVLRMFDQEMASKVREAFDIHVSFSTASQAAPLFATSSSDRTIVNSFYIGEKLYVVARIDVNDNSQLIGKKIRDVSADRPVFVLSHTRAGVENHFPSGDVDFQEGDQLVVQTEPRVLKLLHEWNRDEP
jgi:Trk K+ transport system NAD-binding subunit